MSADTAAPPVIADAAGLSALIDRVRTADRYGLDTEFHRERTYWPQLALLQIAWLEAPDEAACTALVDPIAVDVAPLAEVLRGPGTLVAHAADQDLEILQLACGTGPRRLFDTQVAAAFAGHGSASLSSLTRAYLGRDLPKADRLTDWSARPLTASQLRYAAADVQWLLPLADAVRDDVAGRGRLGWAEEECELLRLKGGASADPARAWWRLRDARQLRGAARGVAQEVAAWREERARRIDVPVRHVLPDLAVQAIAHRPPSSRADLAAVRGLDGRYLRGDLPGELLAAVERGRRLPEQALALPPGDEVPRELKPAVALAMAWMAQLARDEAIDAAVLATRADVVAFLNGDPDGRLASGWRAALVGEPLRRLVAGDAALAFDGAGGLVVEERSGRPLRHSPPAG